MYSANPVNLGRKNGLVTKLFSSEYTAQEQPLLGDPGFTPLQAEK
jgi:hypothetical protein